MTECTDLSNKVVFLLGGPGSGKGTLSQKLVKNLGCLHLSAGDLLRAEQSTPGSPYGELINHYIKEGLIVPAEITVKLLKKAMSDAPNAPLYIVDGFPRAIEQYECFCEHVGQGQFLVWLDVSEETMLERIMKRASEGSGRVDDNIESIRKRLSVMKESTLPVATLFEQRNRLHRIDAEASPEAVYDKCVEIFRSAI